MKYAQEGQGSHAGLISLQFPRLPRSTRDKGRRDRRERLCYNQGIAIKELDHVSVVVDDVAAAIAFLTVLGMTLEREIPAEGRGWTALMGWEVFESTS